MRLGLMTGYWSAGPPADALEAIQQADRLGYDSVWTAEAYGSDVFTPLAWWGSQTERIGLGTGIAQMSARTPVATAMAAMTLDHLSGGRVKLGIGVSGPQVVEGWYGHPFPRPLARTREYIDILRATMRRDVVEYDGEFFQLPYPGGTGLGKALKSTLHPYREEIPIYLAAEGPKNVSLSAELCDGWLTFFFAPKDDGFYRDALQAGFDTRGEDRWGVFDVASPVPFVPNPDIEQAADAIRPHIALYVGGMGSRETNFHRAVFERMGYEEECARITDLYLEGKKQEAAAAVPTRMVEEVALIGSPDKIRDDLARFEESIVTTILIQGPAALVPMAAEIILG